ncbi:hypothetical protein GCM10020370_15190 [Paenibacillus hodogayensis]
MSTNFIQGDKQDNIRITVRSIAKAAGIGYNIDNQPGFCGRKEFDWS